MVQVSHSKHSKTFDLSGVDQRLLFGPNDMFLREIESHFSANLVARGDRVIIEGPERDVEQVVQLLTDLVTRLNQGNYITEQYLNYALAMIQEDGVGPAESISTEALLTNSLKKTIKPRTIGQSKYVEAIERSDIVLAIGPAGTGKTYLAVAAAVAALKANQVHRIIFTRPAVEAGESLGFLPGDIRAKVDPYLRPIYDALHDMMQPDRIRRLLELGIIEIAPLAFMRGRTLNEAFVVLDEAQNTSSAQMKMFLTRIGEKSKAVITGDITQIDLPHPNKSGLVQVAHVLKDMEGIEIIYLTRKDVVRHKIVQRILAAYEEFESSRRKH